MDGAPWDYGMELFQEQTDRIEKELTLGFERYPVLQDVGVKTWVNGAFTFAPDGNPLVGPVMGNGEPEADAWPMDVARFGAFAENKQYIKETTGQFYSRRFVMTYPNEQLPAGRVLKTAGAYADSLRGYGSGWRAMGAELGFGSAVVFRW